MSKADDIFWREFGVILMALVAFTVIVFISARTIGGNAFEKMQNSPKAVLQRIQPVGQVRVGKADQVVVAAAPAASTEAGAGAGKSGEQVYNSACVACHASGVAGAPKVGDKAAWEARLAQGMDALLNVSIKGKGAMPPKGGNASLSDEELKSAIEHMLKKSGLQPG